MRRIARVEAFVPVALVLVLLAALAARAEAPCSVDSPCGPEALRWIGYGALAAPAVMVFVHRWAAAIAAGCCAVFWLAAFSGWVVLLAWAYAGLVIWVARRPTGPADPPTIRRQPTRPASLPTVARPALLLAAASLLVAAGFGSWVLWRQQRADDQQAAARIATGVVHARLTGGLQVDLSGGGSARVGSLTPADYPVGSPVQLYVDDRGLRQLRSEPYNVTPGLALAVVAAGLGAALLAAVGQRRRELRKFFETPQPVRAVRVVDDIGYVHVLVPADDHRTAVEFGIDVTGADPAHTQADTVPATLYGEPRPGQWCAVEVGGRLRVPTAPIGWTEQIAYDEEHAVPQETYDDDEQIVDPAELTAYDRQASPDEVHEHRISPLRAWLETLAIGLGGAFLLAEPLSLAGLHEGWPVTLAVAAGAGLGYEYGWRARIRPRLRWDVGGIASVGFRRRERQPWDEDSAALSDDAGGVTLIAGEAVLTVVAPAPWPPWATQRTADQLVAALRFAQHRAMAADHAPPPPEITVPGRPLALYALWLATIAAAALTTHAWVPGTAFR
jgi:hypothetical protein